MTELPVFYFITITKTEFVQQAVFYYGDQFLCLIFL
jgi:hypothetical protein